eukprot:PhF_6_TR15088/c0_g1_i1/m.23735
MDVIFVTVSVLYCKIYPTHKMIFGKNSFTILAAAGIAAGAYLFFRTKKHRPLPKITSIQITKLFVYPVKSCRGIAVQSAVLTPLGIQYDREWALATTSGATVTQREEPTMSLIQTSLDHTRQKLILSARGSAVNKKLPDLVIDLNPSVYKDQPTMEVTLWGIPRTCRLQGEESRRWLSAFLGRDDVVLVRIDVPVDPRVTASNKLTVPEGSKAMMQDLAHVLVVCDESIDWIHSELPADKDRITAEVFRPNIVVKGGGRFRDEVWNEINISGVPIAMTKPCSRCVIPTIDMEQGTKTPSYQPISLLKEKRCAVAPHKVGREGVKAEPMFGTNGFLVMGSPGGVIRVNDKVEEVELKAKNPLAELG